jgi:hypothetical protein
MYRPVSDTPSSACRRSADRIGGVGDNSKRALDVDGAMSTTSVTLSYPADVSNWGYDQLTTGHMRAYLKKTKGPAREGDTWSVFLDVGCCGDSPDVPLTVTAVDGDGELDEDTELHFEEGAACGVESGWEVQSQAGPS